MGYLTDSSEEQFKRFVRSWKDTARMILAAAIGAQLSGFDRVGSVESILFIVFAMFFVTILIFYIETKLPLNK